MYEIIRNVIAAGGYKLAELQHKIKKLYIWGDLTEEQADELLSLAVSGISADAERPETLEMIRGLADRVTALEERLSATDGTEPEEPAEHEAWAPWDGISNKYQKGEVVTHNGQLWESAFDGHNVWEPGTAGTEALWVKHEPAEEV